MSRSDSSSQSLESSTSSVNELLSSAIYEKNIFAVRYLLTHGADPNARCPVDFAVRKRSRLSWDYLRTLLHKVLHLCGRRNSCRSFCRKPVPLVPSSMDRIERRRVEWSSFEECPNAMHAAAANGRLDVLRELIGYGGDVNSRMENEYTPLILAVLRKKYEAVQFLIDSGADVNACSRLGKSALYYAVKTRKARMVRLLLENHANVNARTTHQATALHVACELRLRDVAELLVKAGADVNARTNSGVTPLHCAAVQGELGLARLILDHGGDPGSIVRFGQVDVSPLLFVNQDAKRKVADLLASYAPHHQKLPSISAVRVANKFVKKVVKHMSWPKIVTPNIFRF